MNEWFDIEEKRPENNQKVLIMLKDASGYNAIYQDGRFITENDPSKNWSLGEVKYWKNRSKTENFNDQVKKRCGMCGRFR
jgi:hypothetical protein